MKVILFLTLVIFVAQYVSACKIDKQLEQGTIYSTLLDDTLKYFRLSSNGNIIFYIGEVNNEDYVSLYYSNSQCPTTTDFDFVFNTSDHKAAKVNNQSLVHLPSGTYEIGLTGKSTLEIEISYKDSGSSGNPQNNDKLIGSKKGRGLDSTAPTGPTAPTYGTSAGPTTPTYGTSAGPTTPTYETSVGPTTPTYGTSAGPTTPTYGTSAGPTTPTYGTSAGPTTPTYGTSAGPTTPTYGTSAGSTYSATSSYGTSYTGATVSGSTSYNGGSTSNGGSGSTYNGGSTSSATIACDHQLEYQCNQKFAECYQIAYSLRDNATICNCFNDYGNCLVSIYCGNGTSSVYYPGFKQACDTQQCGNEICNPKFNLTSDDVSRFQGNQLFVFGLISLVVYFTKLY